MNFRDMTREELLAEFEKVSEKLGEALCRLREQDNADSGLRRLHGQHSPGKDSALSYRDEADPSAAFRNSAEGGLFAGSEHAWQMTFDAVMDPIMVLDDRHRIIRANKAMIDALGFPEEDVIGARCFTLVHGTEAPPALCPHTRLLSCGVAQQEEVFEPRLGGTFSVTVAPICGINGQVIGSVHVARDITAWKEMEEALRENEAKYRELFENSVDIVYIHDLQGNYLSVNEAAQSVLGYSIEEFLSLNFRDIVDPEHLPMVEQYFRKKLAAGVKRTGPYEILTRAKDGHRVWVEVNSRVIEKDGKVEAIHGVARNIEARKKAEEALRSSEERYRMIFDNAPIGITHFDSDGVVVDCNDKFAEIIGAPRETIMGFNLLHEVENRRMLQAVRDCFDGLIGYYEGEYRSVTGGNTTIVRTMFSPLLAEDGQILGGVGLCEDVTERKRSEQIIAERDQTLAGILAASPIGLGLGGFDRQLQWVNGAWLKIFGFEQESECVGKNSRPLYASQEDFERVGRLIQVSLAESGVTETEARLVRKNGIPFDAHIRLQVVGTPGDPKGFIAAVEDVSEKKKAQKEQEELRSQLLQAQKMEAVGTLAGGIAHDFNNLLQVTLGYTELLLSEKNPTDADYADLQKIKEAAVNGADLVRMLLTFSRKVQPKLIPLNLNRQILHVEKILQRTLPKMISVRVNLDDNLREIHADPTQMEQVLMNLAVNARDAMPEGGLLIIESRNITLPSNNRSLWAEAEPGEYVLLSVSDTGHGIDQATIQHVFEPFFTTKELGRGTGLGLAMVYGIVKQHRGHVDCSSEVGKGTSFKIYLPSFSPHPEPLGESSGEMPAFGTETILVVDDEDMVRELGTRFLRRAGYTVLGARTGLEALELYRSFGDRISLVVLDLVMPILGGKDCLREILAINPKARVLVASGYSTGTVIRESLELGAKAFVRKPFRFKELLRQARKVLDERE